MTNRSAALCFAIGLALFAQGAISVRAAEETIQRPSGISRLARLPSASDEVRPLPEPDAEEVPARPFPELPPDPNGPRDDVLPPLAEELWLHGGGFLHEPEGGQAGSHAEHGPARLRLPENWQEPRPWTLFQEFLGADPIRLWPNLHWFGREGFQWEPRFVAYGGYELFGISLDEGGRRQDGIGHQLLVDLDLRLTGTERFHVQYRPIGEENSGGSFLQLSDPSGYIDNSTAVPDRYWFEGELFSVIGGLTGQEFTPRDYHAVVGRFPFALQNRLLMNDDIVGVAVNKNTIYLGDLSNLNVQAFYAFDDVDSPGGESNLLGTNLTADYRHWLFEATYARLFNRGSQARDADFAALGATQFFGRLSLTGRAMFKWGDEVAGGLGAGELFVLESNWTRLFNGRWAHRLDIHHGVFYVNAFYATAGWSPISGGNFDRLRSTFEVNPLITIARGLRDDTRGLAAGVQLFRRNEDESLTPEIAYEAPGGEGILGIGLRYQRKTGPRSFFEVRGLGAWSNDRDLQRSGIFMSETILF